MLREFSVYRSTINKPYYQFSYSNLPVAEKGLTGRIGIVIIGVTI